jgi:hypothetical protein
LRLPSISCGFPLYFFQYSWRVTEQELTVVNGGEVLNIATPAKNLTAISGGTISGFLSTHGAFVVSSGGVSTHGVCDR